MLHTQLAMAVLAPWAEVLFFSITENKSLLESLVQVIFVPSYSLLSSKGLLTCRDIEIVRSTAAVQSTPQGS